MMKQTFMITFGQKHPLRDYWVEVDAESEVEARKLTFEVVGEKWGNIYSLSEFNPEYFPGGRVGRIIK